MVKVNLCMTSGVTELLRRLSAWSSLSAPNCSSVHVDTTEMKQFKFMVIMSYCVNMNNTDRIVLLLVHLFCSCVK